MGGFLREAKHKASGTSTFPTSFQKKLGGYSVGLGSTRSGMQPTRLRPSLSDSTLRKSDGTLLGLASAPKGQLKATALSKSQSAGFVGKAQQFGGTWTPLALNQHKSEQQFVREQVIR